MNQYTAGWQQIPTPAHAHPLVRQLIEEANRQQIKLSEIAERAGLGKKTVTEWRFRKAPSLANVVAALNVLGKTLVIGEREEA